MTPTPDNTSRAKTRAAARAKTGAGVSLPAHDARARVVIERVTPQLEGGLFPCKRVLGDRVAVAADVFADGNDLVAGRVRYRHIDSRSWLEVPLEPLDQDRFQASFTVDTIGEYVYTVEGYIDHAGTWQRDFAKRLDAGQDITGELIIGAQFAEAAALRAPVAQRPPLRLVAEKLRAGASRAKVDDAVELAAATDTALGEDLASLLATYPDREHATVFERELRIVVDRPLARCSAWYERFPRSAAPSPGEHGTLADLQAELPRIAAMGFDVLYLPPIHPIGLAHRKGPNNATVAGDDDPGCPWAIGSAEGGHTDIHPALGTLTDFENLRAAAETHGLELALDLAFQCSPDHPWVTEHPEWFAHRPDGTIRYAENPPKKYEDIYPFNFETDDWEALWLGLKGVVDTWIKRGVKIFRVDNPHTKTFPFWEWLIADVRAANPEVIFLAEAFTRPAVAYRLAKLGFTQSYTYFAWRYSKYDFEQYLTELTQSGVQEFFRPNFWPNTPDILTGQLQYGNRATFVMRLVLAATLAANYGIYGPAFELTEARSVSELTGEASEEYLDSEKYQVRWRDLTRAGAMENIITRINRARREHPALQQNDTLRFLPTTNDSIIAYTKSLPDNSDVMVVVVNLDDRWTQSGFIDLPLAQLGLDAAQPFVVDDLLCDQSYRWQGERNYVKLDPTVTPAHIFHIKPEHA